MAKKFERAKERARQWRLGGMALPEISERLGISRTTVFYWIRKLPPLKHRTQRQTECQRTATRKMQEKCAAIRDRSREDGFQEAEALLEKTVEVRDFVVLFLCEGCRKSRNSVDVANTNPHLIRLAKRVMCRFSRQKISFRLAYHRDVNLESAKAFWAKQMSISPDDIATGKPKVDYNSSNARHIHCLVNGTMRISTCDTAFRQRLQGWCDFVQNKIW